MIRARVFISSALRRLKFFGRVSIFLFFGAMGMAFIQKGGGIFAKLTIRSAADKLVQSPLPQAPTVQQLQALLKDL